MFWPSTIRLSADYFASLQRHAVPLDRHHLAALSHSAMALDVYAWLAQRLHRVGKGKGTPLPWTAVAAQFGGSGYERIRKFRDNFKVAFGQVKTVYRGARVDVSEQGLMLWNSAPPVPPKLFTTTKALPRYTTRPGSVLLLLLHLGGYAFHSIAVILATFPRSLWGAILYVINL